MNKRETYLVRVWLPDRPGALGSVASRFGALKGDVTGLEIVDSQLEALEAAAILLGAETREDLAAALVEHVCRTVRTSWACVMERGGGVVGSWGDRPNDRWLDSFVSGSPAVDVARVALELDTVWIPLPAAGAALVVGRDSILRARERQRLAALARIADAWFRRIKERSDLNALATHPSRF